jgi:acetylornithine deacetylase/succinyl-diaminopimelate desuccinylase-like protein
VAVDGFEGGGATEGGGEDVPARPPFDPEEMRRLVRFRPGVQMCGPPESDPLDRLWWRPSVTVIAIDAPAVEGSSNTIQAAARAKVSFRLAPGQDPERAEAALLAHLRRRVPWGLEATFSVVSRQRPWFQRPAGPVFEAAERSFARAFGGSVWYVGMGGTVPLVGWLSEALGGAIALLTGVEDPESQAHGPDESVHLEDWHRACRAEAVLLGELAGGASS